MAKKTQSFNLDSITFDFDQISAQDVFDFETHSGGVDLQTFAVELQSGAVNDANYMQYLRPMIALIWISARREQPDLAYETVAAQPLVPLFGAVKPAGETPVEPATLKEKPLTAAQRRAARSAAAATADS